MDGILVALLSWSGQHDSRYQLFARKSTPISREQLTDGLKTYFLRPPQRTTHDPLQTSHAGTVVPECIKDDNASQLKSGKFNPRSLKNA